jgi:hypothetical protein
MVQGKYRVLQGPEAFLAPVSAVMGAVLPDAGGAFVEGDVVDEGSAVLAIARKLAGAKNAVVCPGPLLLWQWTEGLGAKAAALRKLAETCGAAIRPITDYKPKNPRVEMNLYHPNVMVLNEEIDVCLFAGVHYHYLNVALRMMRGATSCYTIALCDYAASDEAMISLRDTDTAKIAAITAKVGELKQG